jgi:FADH2 O2-dependent halogenase
LRFNNGITSAGVAAVDDMAEQLRFSEGEPAWKLLLKQLPTVAEQFADARPQLPFVHAPRISFHSAEIIGEHWALLPSAAGVIDPLLSTGFPLVLLGISRLAEALGHGLDSQRFREQLQSYAAQTRNELVATERLVGALYANMKDFELFTSLSFIYFAAASFAEAARRLGRPELASSFLLNHDSDFGPHSRSCLEQALKCLNVIEKEKLVKEIAQTIEPINVAGLGRIDRHNWYPVYASDLLSAAHKLRATKQEVEQLLKRSGFLTGT